LVENIEGILVIEGFGNWCYLLKLKEKLEVSMIYNFAARRIQVPPSAPQIYLSLSLSSFKSPRATG